MSDLRDSSELVVSEKHEQVEADISSENVGGSVGERLQKEKQFDIELSNLMDGKSKVKNDLDQEVFQSDERLQKMSMDERRVMVIDKKTESLMKMAGSENSTNANVDDFLRKAFGSVEDVRALREKVLQQSRVGTDPSGDRVKPGVEQQIQTELDKLSGDYKKNAFDRIMGGIEYTQDLINANIDPETFILLLVGQEVGGGRYGSVHSKKENSDESFDLLETYKFLKNKRRHVGAAFKSCGFPEISKNWGEDDEPHNLDEIEETLVKRIYPDGRKSLIFIKTFLISIGKNELAYSINNPEEAQKLISELKDEIVLK